MDKRGYAVVEGWEQLPTGYTHRDVVGVAVDSRDRAFFLTRGTARVLIYERDGSFVGSWGEGRFTERTHGLTIAPDDSVFVVDEGARGRLQVHPRRRTPADPRHAGRRLGHRLRRRFAGEHRARRAAL